jgi:ferric-dicitrate binding protein FerR (iron transport regulator)
LEIARIILKKRGAGGALTPGEKEVRSEEEEEAQSAGEKEVRSAEKKEALTPEEAEALRAWLEQSAGHREFLEKALAGTHLDDFERTVALTDEAGQWRKLRRAIYPAVAWRRWTARAAGVALLLASGWWAWRDSGEQAREILVADRPVEPAKSRAILVLADGQRLAIEERDTVVTTGYSDITVSGGEAVYSPVEREAPAAAGARNRLIVPVGGIFTVTLSDGTRVFMNSASALEYPATFGGESREVALEGEAFFEVARDEARPFVVRAGQTRAVVLGTSFNLFAYEDEPVHKATLVSGRLAIYPAGTAAGTVLRPGIQAAWRPGDDRVETREVDLAASAAWKDGIIMLDEDALDVVTRMLARWYDVSVFFDEENTRHQHTFTGKIDRNLDLESVLRTLTRLGGPRFEIRGREVHVH